MLDTHLFFKPNHVRVKFLTQGTSMRVACSLQSLLYFYSEVFENIHTFHIIYLISYIYSFTDVNRLT